MGAIRCIVLTGTLVGGFVAGRTMTASDRIAWDADESRGSLFNETGAHPARASAIDTTPTKSRWRASLEMTVATSSNSSKEMAAVFPLQQAQSYYVPPVQSDPQCSVNVNPPPGSGDPPNIEHHCSTAAMPTVPFNVGPACSTANNDPNVGPTIVCSAIGSGPADGYPGNRNYCSSGAPVGNIVACSTKGGASGGANGNVACSAGYTPVATPDLGSVRYCSTAGDMASPEGLNRITCSTGGGSGSAAFGEHQICSSGMGANYGDYAFCSAQSGQTAGENFCSVNKPSSGGWGNKCSAMNMPAGQGGGSQNGTRQCSVSSPHEGDMSNDFCSVRAPAQIFSACTVMTMGTTANPSLELSYCSTDAPTPPELCSVIQMDGTVTPPMNGLCGFMQGHHGFPQETPPEPLCSQATTARIRHAGLASFRQASCPACDEPVNEWRKHLIH